MSRKSGIVIELDADVAEAIVRLADYASDATKVDFINKVVSILLTSLMIDTNDYTGDFEELATRELENSDNTFKFAEYSAAWAEWLLVKEGFQQQHRRQDYVIDALKDIAMGRRELSAHMFDVRVSVDGRTVAVR